MQCKWNGLVGICRNMPEYVGIVQVFRLFSEENHAIWSWHPCSGPRAIGRAQWSQWSSPRHIPRCRSIPEPQLRCLRGVQWFSDVECRISINDDQRCTAGFLLQTELLCISRLTPLNKELADCLKGHTSWSDHTWQHITTPLGFIGGRSKVKDRRSAQILLSIWLVCSDSMDIYGQMSAIQVAKTIFTAGLHCHALPHHDVTKDKKPELGWQTGIWSASRLHEIYRNC